MGGFYLPLLIFGEHTKVVYISYTMATQDFPDIYAHALGLQLNKDPEITLRIASFKEKIYQFYLHYI